MSAHIEIKATLAIDDAGGITAMAWPFATPDRVGDWIEPGAFAKAALPIPMLFGHDANDPVGAWESATEKKDGLHLQGRLLVDDLPRAREVRALVKAGAVRGISIASSPKRPRPAPAAAAPSHNSNCLRRRSSRFRCIPAPASQARSRPSRLSPLPRPSIAPGRRSPQEP